MDQRGKDILKTAGLLIISIIGAVLLISTADSFFWLMWGIAFAGYSVMGLIKLIRLLTTQEKSPEEVAAAVEEKFANVPKLEAPCEVSITRTSSMLGAAMAVVVYLHDFEVGRLKNGKTLNFSTEYATNELKLYYQADGNLLTKTFTAAAGGSVCFEFNYAKGKIEII
jgi:hypothetical protein